MRQDPVFAHIRESFATWFSLIKQMWLMYNYWKYCRSEDPKIGEIAYFKIQNFLILIYVWKIINIE